MDYNESVTVSIKMDVMEWLDTRPLGLSSRYGYLLTARLRSWGRGTLINHTVLGDEDVY